MRGSPMGFSCPRTGPTMSVKAREEFLKLDQVTQDKLRKLNKEVTVRASS